MTGVAGLAPFGSYVRRLGVDDELDRRFDRLKGGPAVVYPMGAQLRLLIDAFVVGKTRVSGVKKLATDALFAHLAGGVVPSLQTLYEDLDRFDDEARADLEELVATHGMAHLPTLRAPYVHLDVETGAPPLGGEHGGAPPDPPRRSRRRRSFHPVLAIIAETGTIVGARSRPGDAGLERDDVPAVRRWVVRARDALGPGVALCVRTAVSDCAELLRMLYEERAFYVVQPRLSDILAVTRMDRPLRWRTVAHDAYGQPVRQIAELPFAQCPWEQLGVPVRVIFVRWPPGHGEQPLLVESAPWPLQVLLTNRTGDANEIAHDHRGGTEPLLAELQGVWGLGHASGHGISANHAVLLLKLLSYNLFERYLAQEHPALARAHPRRRTLLVAPGRLSVSGRIHRLHLPPSSPLRLE